MNRVCSLIENLKSLILKQSDKTATVSSQLPASISILHANSSPPKLSWWKQLLRSPRQTISHLIISNSQNNILQHKYSRPPCPKCKSLLSEFDVKSLSTSQARQGKISMPGNWKIVIQFPLCLMGVSLCVFAHAVMFIKHNQQKVPPQRVLKRFTADYVSVKPCLKAPLLDHSEVFLTAAFTGMIIFTFGNVQQSNSGVRRL